MFTDADSEQLASTCYAILASYENYTSDSTYTPWENSSIKFRIHFVNEIALRLECINPTIPPEEFHQLWFEKQFNLGWRFGQNIDVEKKLDPKILPYDQLDKNMIVRTNMFSIIVLRLADLMIEQRSIQRNKAFEEAAQLHESINTASDIERLNRDPGAGAIGAIIEYRDAIRQYARMHT